MTFLFLFIIFFPLPNIDSVCCTAATVDAAFDFIADAAVGGGFGDSVVVVAVTAAFDVVAPVAPLSYFPVLYHLIHAR